MATFSFNRDDRLNQALIKSAIIVGIGLLVTGLAWQLRTTAETGERSFQRQMDYLRDEVAELRQDRLWTETYQPNYDKMVADGLIGSESRLEWRALVVNLAKKLELPDVKITLSPRINRNGSTEQFDDGLSSDPVTSYESQMTLGLTLFHALDLLPLLDELDQSATAILIPQRCSLALEKDPLYLDAVPLIKSDCDLSWVTVQPTPMAESNDAF